MQERTKAPDPQQCVQFFLAQLKRRAKAYDEVATELTQFLTHLKVEELALLSLNEMADYAEVTSQAVPDEEEMEAAQLPTLPDSRDAADTSLTQSCMDVLFDGEEIDFDFKDPIQEEEEEEGAEEEFDALSFVASVINP